jgi:integrase
VDVIEAVVTKEIYPVLGEQRIDKVTLGDISSLILAIRDRGSNDTARRTLFQIRKMWRFAELKFNLPVNPAANLRPGDYHLRTSGTRERILDNKELKVLWRLLDDEDAHGMSLAVRAGIKLLLLTGVRSSEVRNMRWEHVDLDHAVWTIPPELHKGGQSGPAAKKHQVPLTPAAVALLRSLARDSALVLPSEAGSRRLSEKAFTRALHRLQVRQDGTRGLLLERLDRELKDWVKFSAHDLRRTLATRLSGELGVDPAVRERILAHSLGKLEAAYNRHNYLPEQRAALEKWERRLMEIVDEQG